MDIQQFQQQDTRYKDLYMFLKSKQYDVATPAERVGDCLSPYIVIRHSGSAQVSLLSTDEDIYDIMIYVPRNAYTQLEVLQQKIKKDMQEVQDIFKPRRSNLASFYDDSIKAHMLSMSYGNYKLILRNFKEE